MSHLLWKYYWENDVDKFRRLLAPAGYSQTPSKSPGHGVGSPGPFGSSPRALTKTRKASGFGANIAGAKNAGNSLGKADVNSRDHSGLTILLRAASSTSSQATCFVEALLEHPAVDIYIQDPESGWNALHRSLYSGNISVARLLLEKERRDLTDSIGPSNISRVGQLIKTKDHEGNSPFDLYNATIALRSLKAAQEQAESDNDSEVGGDGEADVDAWHHHKATGLGEEVFTFGSNKNLSLGLGDEDDRQYPERVYLKRPDHLIHYFHDQYMKQRKRQSDTEYSRSHDLADVPALIQNRSLAIQDVVLSKLHSAILTADPFSNLYVAGIGRNGRLGLGDENTRFNFMPVQGGLMEKKVTQVALGQNHSMAVTSDGELWTWGSNAFSQLGFALPPVAKPDEEPISTTPRQVFGPLKKEFILGVAASSIHSVAHTGSSLFCWGKNVGQLALMDADSRSLEVQMVPRKVAATLLSSHSAITMVSAIDRATTILFEDHTVCVLTSYGYKIIRFPLPDGLTSSLLQRSGRVSSALPYDSKYREIDHITSGGDTIIAVTGSGDLFTMQLNHKSEDNQPSVSTTNPAKIKDAITTPQCIWHSRKDGVKSASVDGDGSVIISTLSGAVWRRVKCTKAKDTKGSGSADSKRRDFKFQRVPYITDVTAVRASPFGAYAAVRMDCDITRDQLEVDEPKLWQDISPLMPLHGFMAQNAKARENKDTWKFQDPGVLMGNVDGLVHQVLTSTDLEEDLGTHLRNLSFRDLDYGTVIRTESNPNLAVPIHTWILSARSPLLRAGLQRFRETGEFDVPEFLTMFDESGTLVLELAGSIDLITLLNLVVYFYTDQVIPAWNFTRQSPPLAYRYRQIRTELMKVATRLGMSKLETAVRLQRSPLRSMQEDFRKAIDDPAFFEDGDALLELDGDAIPVHSTLLCERCPWFQGLFNGRSKGKWLEGRRAAQDDSDRVTIDMQHMDPESFHYVLQYLYADVGEDIFDSVIADSIDDFSELVMDVMSIANELMLDRLSQICQTTIGRYVTTRNISTLLNLIGPCSVTEFKDKGLEYICLQMEAMLENHLLDNLDDYLLFELDEVVRANQLDKLPYVRSGHAELVLHEQNPELVLEIEEERRIRVKEMAYRAAPREDERKLSSSFKTRLGSLDDLSGTLPTPERSRQKSFGGSRNEPFSPDLRPRESQNDLIFEMDEEDESNALGPVSPSPRPLPSRDKRALDLGPPLTEHWPDARKKASGGSPSVAQGPHVSPHQSSVHPSKSISDAIERRVSQGGNPWGSANLPTTRLDLREMLAEPKPAQSALSAGLAAEKKETAARATPQKLSQKERKKQLQRQAEQVVRQDPPTTQQSQAPWSKVSEDKGSPWQKTTAPSTSAKDIPKAPSTPTAGLPNAKPLVAAETSSGKSTPRRTASPDTRFAGQKSNTTPRGSMTPARPDPQPLLAPHSKSYIKRTPRPEQEMTGLGLADIIGQQQREQQSTREAVAKRSLQEIQQEQAFQEWWDQESRRTQEEEARRGVARDEGRDNNNNNNSSSRKKEGGGGGRRGRSSHGNKPRGASSSRTAGGGSSGGGGDTGAAETAAGSAATAAASRGRGRGTRGRRS
ncbi:hypothetical protein GGR56DRAFT_636912 [Xylariaceae sp. FL0804]|nr:hypothetical protein GGR56DRAFT_636912 [Xylariaceae sp. FL0804]